MAQPTYRPSGRGAESNASGRFEALSRETFDDGWNEDDAAPAPLRTTMTPEAARVIISRNDSPDIRFDRSINPYRGCEHGCIYCYARPSHAYVGPSPGLDFESKLFFKPGAARLLEAELSRKAYKPATIHIGGNTDPYQPQERRLRVTRQVIEVLSRFAHPFSIITKSALIARDIDLLAPMAALDLVRVAISVTTLDRKLARVMEPRAATPERRLDALRALSEAGVPTAVMFAPVIPGLNDHEMESVLERAAQAGAATAGYTVLRLPREIKDLFREWLTANVPDRAARVMSLVRQMRGGKDYDAEWGKRMKGDGPIAELIAQRFRIAPNGASASTATPGPPRHSQFRVPATGGRSAGSVRSALGGRLLEQDGLGQEGRVSGPRGQARRREQGVKVEAAIGAIVGLVEVGRKGFQQTTKTRFVHLLNGIGEGQKAARLQHPGDLADHLEANFGRQFMKEIDASHRVETGVGERQVLGVGLDQGLDAGRTPRLLQIGG